MDFVFGHCASSADRLSRWKWIAVAAPAGEAASSSAAASATRADVAPSGALVLWLIRGTL